MSPWFFVNFGCMCFSLWVAFGKTFRPLTWGAFWFNIGAAAINAAGVAYHIFFYLAKA